MSKGINLLPPQTKSTAIILTKLQLIRGIAVVLLFGISFLSLALSVLIAFSPLPKLKTQESELMTFMTALHPKIAKQMVVTERITAANLIIKKRPAFDTLIGSLQDAIPLPSTINELKLTRTELVVQFSSSSLALIDTAIASIQKLNDEKKLFSKIVIENVLFNYETGSYTATVQMILRV